MKRDSTTPIECVKDAKAAIRWLRKNAAEYGIAPNRLAPGGSDNPVGFDWIKPLVIALLPTVSEFR